VCSEASAYKIQTPGNYPEEIIQHSEQGESLISRNEICLYDNLVKPSINGTGVLESILQLQETIIWSHNYVGSKYR